MCSNEEYKRKLEREREWTLFTVMFLLGGLAFAFI